MLPIPLHSDHPYTMFLVTLLGLLSDLVNVSVSCSVSSDSLRLLGPEPASLLRPWDFPGKNTGVGCHALLQRIFPTQGSNPRLLHCSRFFTVWATRSDLVPRGKYTFCPLTIHKRIYWASCAHERKWKWSRSVVSDSLQPHVLQPARLLRSWDFPDKNTGVGRHFLLQGIFPTQGSNPGAPHSRQKIYHLSPQGKPVPNIGQDITIINKTFSFHSDAWNLYREMTWCTDKFQSFVRDSKRMD